MGSRILHPASEDRPHRRSVQVSAAAGGQQQVARGVSTERADVVQQRLPCALTESDHPLLVPLGVLDQHPLGGEVHVGQLQVGELVRPQARVQQH